MGLGIFTYMKTHKKLQPSMDRQIYPSSHGSIMGYQRQGQASWMGKSTDRKERRYLYDHPERMPF